jgi:hypothetical protein
MRQNGKAGQNAMPYRPNQLTYAQLRGAAWSMALLMPPQDPGLVAMYAD